MFIYYERFGDLGFVTGGCALSAIGLIVAAGAVVGFLTIRRAAKNIASEIADKRVAEYVNTQDFKQKIKNMIEVRAWIEAGAVHKDMLESRESVLSDEDKKGGKNDESH